MNESRYRVMHVRVSIETQGYHHASTLRFYTKDLCVTLNAYIKLSKCNTRYVHEYVSDRCLPQIDMYVHAVSNFDSNFDCRIRTVV